MIIFKRIKKYRVFVKLLFRKWLELSIASIAIFVTRKLNNMIIHHTELIVHVSCLIFDLNWNRLCIWGFIRKLFCIMQIIYMDQDRNNEVIIIDYLKKKVTIRESHFKFLPPPNSPIEWRLYYIGVTRSNKRKLSKGTEKLTKLGYEDWILDT